MSSAAPGPMLRGVNTTEHAELPLLARPTLLLNIGAPTCLPQGSNNRWCFEAPGSHWSTGSQHHCLTDPSHSVVPPGTIAGAPFSCLVVASRGDGPLVINLRQL